MIQVTVAEATKLWKKGSLWQGPDGTFRLDLDVVEDWYGVEPEQPGGSIPVEFTDGDFNPKGSL